MERIAFKLYRAYLGLTTQDVADYLVCTKQPISNFELGKTNSGMLEKFYEEFLFNELDKLGIEKIDIIVTKKTT